MELGIIGLGRMGSNMAIRLQHAGHHVVGYDFDSRVIQAATKNGLEIVNSPKELIDSLEKPRIIWLMLPSGEPTQNIIQLMTEHLEPRDILVDGGNSHYKDTIKMGKFVQNTGIEFADIGTSGGIWGLSHGYCLMVGGNDKVFKHLTPILESLSAGKGQGYGHVGPSGSGHFVKMIHNAIEYALMEGYAEGFELLKAKSEFNLDLAHISRIWQSGSVIRSWLLEITGDVLNENQTLEHIQSYVEDSGEGRWAVEESIELGIPIPSITLSLQSRFRSQQPEPFGLKLMAAMRQKFGGHSVRPTAH
jgi:6-phosphogluconate dehydrogenase